MSIAGQTIVIVGGSSGMGLAAAAELAARGAELVLVGRDEGKLRAAAESVPGARIAALDCSDAGATAAWFAALERIDHLVVAASGNVAWGPFAELDPARLRAAFEGKFWVHFHAARYAAPRLPRAGSITFVIGASARAAMPGTAGLSAVNAAIAGMARTLAVELAPVRVNALSPGFVDTPVYDHLPADDRAALYERMASSLPVGRIGQVADIAPAIAFLVENGFTTGAVLDVDGGATL